MAYCRSTRLRELALPSQRSFVVTLNSGSKARVQLLLPPSWREELRDAAFPVLVHVYVVFVFQSSVSRQQVKLFEPLNQNGENPQDVESSEGKLRNKFWNSRMMMLR